MELLYSCIHEKIYFVDFQVFICYNILLKEHCNPFMNKTLHRKENYNVKMPVRVLNGSGYTRSDQNYPIFEIEINPKPETNKYR